MSFARVSMALVALATFGPKQTFAQTQLVGTSESSSRTQLKRWSLRAAFVATVPTGQFGSVPTGDFGFWSDQARTNEGAVSTPWLTKEAYGVEITIERIISERFGVQLRFAEHFFARNGEFFVATLRELTQILVDREWTRRGLTPPLVSYRGTTGHYSSTSIGAGPSIQIARLSSISVNAFFLATFNQLRWKDIDFTLTADLEASPGLPNEFRLPSAGTVGMNHFGVKIGGSVEVKIVQAFSLGFQGAYERLGCEGSLKCLGWLPNERMVDDGAAPEFLTIGGYLRFGI